MHDPLTGLPGRALVRQRTISALEQIAGSGRQLAVLIVDIDQFRVVNDSLGRGAGDEVLLRIAERIQRMVRPDDIVGRLDADEFLIAFGPVHDPAEAVALAGRVAWELGRPYAVDDREIVLTISTGIVVTTPDHGGAEAALRDAELAMYRAKAAGGARAMVFSDDMRAETVRRFELEAELRHAVDAEQFELYYQSEVRLSDLSVAGAEALVRWNAPGRGMVSPAEFIPLAEQSGLVIAIGDWVLRRACAQLRSWEDAGRSLAMSVNLSVRQLADIDCVFHVQDVLQRSGIAPQSLTLEITESHLMRDVDNAVGVMHTLRSLGVRLSIDDFGSGYTSLTHLKRMPVDELKIDRSFVVDIADDARDRCVVKALVEMAHGLGMSVVAEGVETPGQLDALRALGCDLAQGFLLARPVPADRMKFALPPAMEVSAAV